MKSFLLFAVGLCFALTACQQQQSASASNNYADTTATGTPGPSGSSSAAVENRTDTVHKFVRTADIRFKVSNVESATYKIEDIAVKYGGFVTKTQLRSDITATTTTAISPDSMLEQLGIM